MPPRVPQPTPIYRLRHVDCLKAIIARGGMFAPSCEPKDGLVDSITHDKGVQGYRATHPVHGGPGGTLLDYVPFYFGVLSPMLFRLATGRVEGHTAGQGPIIYLASDVQAVVRAKRSFVFTDGQANKATTEHHDDPAELKRVDWALVNQRYWNDTPDDPDRMRRKQAEFLLHQFCPFELVSEIGVLTEEAKERVEAILKQARTHRPVVRLRPEWYYPNRK
jgi:hypothetical protein